MRTSPMSAPTKELMMRCSQDVEVVSVKLSLAAASPKLG